MMLDCTFDMITLAASNSLVAFCFCNLIIAILFVASSKPSTATDIDEQSPPPRPPAAPPAPVPGVTMRKECVSGDDASNWHPHSEDVNESEALEKVAEEASGSDAVIILNCEDENPDEEASVSDDVIVQCEENNPDELEDDECQNEDDDDELRRRIEEFIAKVNKGWEAEKLGIYAS